MLLTAANSRRDHIQVDRSQEIMMHKEFAVEAVELENFLRASELIIWLKDNDQRSFRERSIILATRDCPERKFYNSLNTVLNVKFNTEDAPFNYAVILQDALNSVEIRLFSEFCNSTTARYKKMTSEAILGGYYDLAIKTLNVLSLCKDLTRMKD